MTILKMWTSCDNYSNSHISYGSVQLEYVAIYEKLTNYSENSGADLESLPVAKVDWDVELQKEKIAVLLDKADIKLYWTEKLMY